MFSSNDTPAEEFKKAEELGAIINLDDITHIDFLEKSNRTYSGDDQLPIQSGRTISKSVMISWTIREIPSMA